MARLPLITTGHQRNRSVPLMAVYDHCNAWIPYASVARYPLITIPVDILCDHWYPWVPYTSIARLPLITIGHQRYRSVPLVSLCDHWYPWVPYTYFDGSITVDHHWPPKIAIGTATVDTIYFSGSLSTDNDTFVAIRTVGVSYTSMALLPLITIPIGTGRSRHWEKSERKHRPKNSM